MKRRSHRPIDGEVVALDEGGRPSFSALQNRTAGASIVYCVFDVMVLGGRNVMGEPLATRRDLLSREVLPLLADPVREGPRFDAALAELIAAVRAQKGLVAKRHRYVDTSSGSPVVRWRIPFGAPLQIPKGSWIYELAWPRLGQRDDSFQKEPTVRFPSPGEQASASG